MKNKKLIKHISLMLIVAMLVQMIVVPGLNNGNMTVEASDTQGTNVYEDGFNYQPNINSLLGTETLTDEWDIETVKNASSAPEIVDGVLRMDDNDGIQFNWLNVEGVESFDTSKTYTFEFDAIVRDSGDNLLNGSSITTSKTRILYVAPGGDYNQIEIKDSDNKVKMGYAQNNSDVETYVAEEYKDQKIHITLVLKNNEITTTLTKSDGTVLAGRRVNDYYATANTAGSLMRYIVLRCEDGAVDIDNFAFTDGTNTYKQNFEEYFWATEQWDIETVRYMGTAPKVSNGSLKMSRTNSVQFDWTEVEGVEAYNSANPEKYTFEFDAKVTNYGNKSDRNLYVAPGGWYNQIALNPKAGTVVTGRIDNGSTDDAETYDYLNQNLHIQLVWEGQYITSTITDEAGNVINTGYRKSSSYNSMTADYKSMTYLVLRCEDGEIEIDNFKFTVGDTIMYTEDFAVCGLDPMVAMLDTSVWEVSNKKGDALTPYLSSGVVKMRTKTTLEFNWKNIPGIGEYDSTTIYTYEFDVIPKHKGDNFSWNDASETHTRMLYVANNEHYTQIELFRLKSDVTAGQIKVANGASAAWTNDYLNSTLHMKIEWVGNTVTSTITDASGKVIVSDDRTITVDSNMDDLTFRCEDGAVDIKNFKFTKVKTETVEQKIEIPEGKQAIYTCNVAYSKGSAVKFDVAGKTFGNADASGELFKISDNGLSIGGYACAGTFGEGTYGVKIELNPLQKAAMVEVTLPNGGVIRRGSHALLYQCTSVTKIITTLMNGSNAVSDNLVTYEYTKRNDYEFNSTGPVYEGFEANVYNLVTAFDVDAKTTRTFAWTALESFIGEAAMAVQYRVEGTTEWTTVDAVKEIEKTEYDTEDYFKADIYNLTAGTTYEYRIGNKASTDETNDWSKIYTFTTEAENVDEFSFVAIGDSQGADWNGDLMAGRGYKYAQAALNQAVADTGNPAFILHTGDITEHGTKQSQWNYYFKALGDFGKTIPHFAAVGNHDVWADSTNEAPGSAENFDLHFNHPNNGGSAAFAEDVIEKVDAYNHESSSSLVRNLDETTYSFNYGNVHFVVLNTGAYDKAVGPIDKIIIEAQTEWLINDLEANKDAEWTILMMHEPLYHRLESYTRLEGIHKVIEEYGVDLAILGHSHLVTRTYPMKDGQIVTKAVTNEIEAGTGTVYSTIGSTVASHDQYGAGVLENMHTVFTPANEQPTYTTVSVNDGEIKVTIKQVDGLVVDEYTIFKEVFTGASLTLSDKIGVNFYVSNSYEFSDDAYVEFTLEDGETQTVLLKDADVKAEGKRVTCWVPAKEMADEITATLYEGEETKATLTTSVKEYAKKLFDQSEKDASCAAAKPLVNAMINYGAYAQLLFNYNVDKLANNNEGYNKVYFEDNVADVSNSALDKFAKEKQGKDGFGHLAGATLVLKEEIKLKLFFEFEAGVSLEGLTFSVDGVQQTPTKSGDYYVVEIKGITASLLDKDHTVRVSVGDNSFDAVTSVMTGCYNALNNPELADMHNIAKALYLYNDAAKTYRNGSN